jgi:chemotaxis protein methyltransferase CheR
LFDGSMSKLAYLALGSRETIKFSDIQDKFTQVGTEKIWRKIK